MELQLQHLNTLVNGLLLAQKRGVFSFEESSTLFEPMKSTADFLNAAKEKAEADAKEKAEAESQTEKMPELEEKIVEESN